jgi:hypothetical protein
MTVRALQDYTRRNAPSSLHIYSETQRFHLCEVNRYYHTVMGAASHRADAIVFEDTDPFHPWFLDFVQAQIDNPDSDKALDHLNVSHRAKVTALIRDHEGIPKNSIIPMAFASNGVFHPAALAFIDWFLVRAARTPINEPPSIEKLKVLNAMSAAIVDQTASILTAHFSLFITSLHEKSFPMVLASASQSGIQRPVRRAPKALPETRLLLPIHSLLNLGLLLVHFLILSFHLRHPGRRRAVLRNGFDKGFLVGWWRLG